MKYAGVPDKILVPWLKDKEYIVCSDEGEAVAIMAGYYFATGETGTAFMSADGLMNALNFLTSWIIPEQIPMNLVISMGRQEPPHKIASDISPSIMKRLNEYPNKLSYLFIKK